MNFRVSSFRRELQVDTIPTYDGVDELSQVILAELEGAVGNESQQGKKDTIVLLNAEVSEEGKGKGKTKQESLKGKEAPKAESGEAAKGDNRPKAKSDPKAQNKPQCFKWIQEEGCPYGVNCQYARSPDVKGRCCNCGATDHMKPACTRPGCGSFHENAEPTGKGKGKGKGKSVAKAQVASSSGSAETPNSGATSSGGTSGIDSVDIKVIKEV